jgi:hypothetical protein
VCGVPQTECADYNVREGQNLNPSRSVMDGRKRGRREGMGRKRLLATIVPFAYTLFFLKALLA